MHVLKCAAFGAAIAIVIGSVAAAGDHYLVARQPNKATDSVTASSYPMAPQGAAMQGMYGASPQAGYMPVPGAGYGVPGAYPYQYPNAYAQPTGSASADKSNSTDDDTETQDTTETTEATDSDTPGTTTTTVMVDDSATPTDSATDDNDGTTTVVSGTDTLVLVTKTKYNDLETVKANSEEKPKIKVSQTKKRVGDLPIYVVLFIIVGSAFLIGIAIFFLVKCCRRRRNRQMTNDSSFADDNFNESIDFGTDAYQTNAAPTSFYSSYKTNFGPKYPSGGSNVTLPYGTRGSSREAGNMMTRLGKKMVRFVTPGDSQGSLTKSLKSKLGVKDPIEVPEHLVNHELDRSSKSVVSNNSDDPSYDFDASVSEMMAEEKLKDKTNEPQYHNKQRSIEETRKSHQHPKPEDEPMFMVTLSRGKRVPVVEYDYDSSMDESIEDNAREYSRRNSALAFRKRQAELEKSQYRFPSPTRTVDDSSKTMDKHHKVQQEANEIAASTLPSPARTPSATHEKQDGKPELIGFGYGTTVTPLDEEDKGSFQGVKPVVNLHRQILTKAIPPINTDRKILSPHPDDDTSSLGSASTICASADSTEPRVQNAYAKMEREAAKNSMINENQIQVQQKKSILRIETKTRTRSPSLKSSVSHEIQLPSGNVPVYNLSQPSPDSARDSPQSAVALLRNEPSFDSISREDLESQKEGYNDNDKVKVFPLNDNSSFLLGSSKPKFGSGVDVTSFVAPRDSVVSYSATSDVFSMRTSVPAPLNHHEIPKSLQNTYGALDQFGDPFDKRYSVDKRLSALREDSSIDISFSRNRLSGTPLEPVEEHPEAEAEAEDGLFGRFKRLFFTGPSDDEAEKSTPMTAKTLTPTTTEQDIRVSLVDSTFSEHESSVDHQ